MHHEPESRPRPPFRDQGISEPGLEKKMDPKPQYEGAEYRAAGKLEGKVALVTGGDSGIGRSVAVLYAREGAKLAVVYLEEEQPDAEKTRDEVQDAGSEALLIPGDVRDPGFCEQAVEHTIETFGQLDILVNNAAYQKHQDGIGDDGEWFVL
jgi:NAD(P)-dependent dehydrogenase (short-subunit alcohol dehydrogenase family)